MGLLEIVAQAVPTEALQKRAELGFDNISENNGIGIAVTGLLIVFVALILISVFISMLPRILESLEFILPAEHHTHAAVVPRTTDNEKIAAAVGFVLHEIRSKQQ